ncbi:hypothetical protein AVEN_263563-1 [Araneus ventricosus]|uniref:Secreted protein n=1 Tax=Araneus ventricosus TaxID=182803 RepID=A0A4Y2HU12_ARAVE|nr:hypothetical protein AVEN_263563-1 [Araneus ventricosus]
MFHFVCRFAAFLYYSSLMDTLLNLKVVQLQLKFILTSDVEGDDTTAVSSSGSGGVGANAASATLAASAAYATSAASAALVASDAGAAAAADSRALGVRGWSWWGFNPHYWRTHGHHHL